MIVVWETDYNFKKIDYLLSNATASTSWWSRKDFAKKDRHEDKVTEKSG